MSEIRWYKGKYRVEVVLKSKGNWRVKVIDPFVFGYVIAGKRKLALANVEGDYFTTVPRLLWRHPRK